MAVIPKFVPNPNGNPLIKEYAWKPGQSGNPGGQWAEKPFVKALRDALKEENNKDSLRKIAQKLIDLAIEGESWAIQMIGDRLDGKTPQTVTFTRDPRAMSMDEIIGELTDTRTELEAARAAAGDVREDAGTGEPTGVH